MNFKNKYGTLGAIMFFLAIVVVPILFSSLDQEPVSWQMARARYLLKLGEREKARSLVQDALTRSQNGHDRLMQLEIAKWMYENGQADQALSLINKLQQESDGGTFALFEEMQCLRYLGRHREALGVYKLLSKGADKSVAHVNNLSYFRGLANVELRAAIEDMNQLINEFSATNGKSILGFQLSMLDQYLVSLAVCSRQYDKQASVLELLDRRIENVSQGVDRAQQVFSNGIYQMFSRKFPLTRKQERMVKEDVFENDKSKQRLIILLTCRAILSQDLKRSARCDQDRLVIQRMGFDPNDWLKKLPSDQYCSVLLEESTAWLDTRGVVLAALGQFRQARRDYDLAILASEMHISRIQRNSILNEGLDIQAALRSHATLIYHRMQLNEMEGEMDMADQDRQRILALGFEPGDQLF